MTDKIKHSSVYRSIPDYCIPEDRKQDNAWVNPWPEWDVNLACGQIVVNLLLLASRYQESDAFDHGKKELWELTLNLCDEVCYG